VEKLEADCPYAAHAAQTAIAQQFSTLRIPPPRGRPAATPAGNPGRQQGPPARNSISVGIIVRCAPDVKGSWRRKSRSFKQIGLGYGGAMMIDCQRDDSKMKRAARMLTSGRFRFVPVTFQARRPNLFYRRRRGSGPRDSASGSTRFVTVCATRPRGKYLDGILSCQQIGSN